MRKLPYILLALLWIGCGITFETMTLEDPNLVGPEDGMRYFKAPTVYKDATDNVWGLEKDDCKDFKSIKKDEHGSVLKLEWAKTSCDWVGMGIGWNNWQPKDLLTIMETADLVMDIRAIEDKTNIPIIVFLLEDYGGVMSAAVSGGYCLETYPITEDWQEFRMPMNRFDYQTCGIDLSNVKQLVMECQGYGSVLIDNIRIEAHKERSVKKKEFPPHTIDADDRMVIFDGDFDKVWGLGKYESRDFNVRGNTLELEWDQCDNCQWQRMGTSWAGWKGVDFTDKYDDLKLMVEVGERNINNGDLLMVMEAYSFAHKKKALSAYIEKSGDGKQTFSIPLSDFSTEGEFWSRIKQLRFEFEGKGSVNIHRIEIVKDVTN
ncbi:MAG: hypothetical protein MK081_12985 [Flavobacteriales bacterium]|nr:hypothetical protein [Flavobacteriales bacterium]